jgi:hypothetical protein
MLSNDDAADYVDFLITTRELPDTECCLCGTWDNDTVFRICHRCLDIPRQELTAPPMTAERRLRFALVHLGTRLNEEWNADLFAREAKSLLSVLLTRLEQIDAERRAVIAASLPRIVDDCPF